MAIGNKQIGFSNEANLLWEISRQLDRINSQMCVGNCPTTTTSTSSTTTTTTTAPLFENRFEYSPGTVPSIEEFEALIGFTLENPVIEGDTVKFTNVGYTIPANAFQTASLLDVVSFANIVEVLAFQGCSSLTSVSFPQATSIGSSCFEVDDALVNISIPACVNLGSNPTDYSMFFDIVGNVISVTINSVLTTINAGGMHVGIVILQTYNTVTLTVV
jgi:hypothetical protein